MRHFPTTGLLLALVGLLPGRLARADDKVDYLRSVKPILTARCIACHGALQQKSGLRVDTAELMKKGGDAGAVVVPGKSGESSLVERISSNKNRMPPSSEGEPLKDSEIALIKLWIDQGANAPADEKPEADPRDHWAFKAPVRPPVPKIANTKIEIRNAVDAFVATKWEKEGLTPQKPAEKSVLLRRVYLDLIGLPPTREEIQAFVADTSVDAYEKVVDRLLRSPQYGERWGRHWMDVWRYSDWWGLGAEVRNSQKHIWHWRDWIIESLNADKGYDQMLREMLAGDELYPTDLDKLRATGYLARSYFKFNRNSWLDEVVEHSGKAFLGLTFNCAKCHDHKYDPVAQQDYYRLRAFFEPYQCRTDMLAGETDYEKNGLPRAFDCNLDTPTYLFVRGDEKNPRKNRKIEPGLPSILFRGELTIKPVTLPAEAHSPGLRTVVVDNYLKQAEQRIATACAKLEQARKTLAEVERKPVVHEPKPMPVAPMTLVKDDFSKEKAELWEIKTGKWSHKNGKLHQESDGDNRAAIRLKHKVPVDFEARFKVVVLGGQMWKSVGLSFDVVGNDETLVYLSAYAGGPKLQVALGKAGQYSYPPTAVQNRAVKLSELQDVTIRVRGELINVVVNGQPALAYRLPEPRKPGAIDLITYDAKADFNSFELNTLPSSVQMVNVGTPNAKPHTLEQARLAVVAAEKAVAAAEAQPAAIKARAAADRARATQAANATELARAAARAEKLAAVADAEEYLARAQIPPINGATKTQGEANLAAARKALENPGDTYTPLRGSLKTAENNLESDVQRAKPFPTTSSGRRTALAQWITESKNPLTARVAVNHIWLRHMGKPLVPTVFDFGRKGAAPTHPELLDWLAVELVEKRWSMKHLHRLIVTSNAYRMSSSAKQANEKDPENRYYWRMNSLRMEAQVIRDSLLHLSGDLDATMGGPSIPVNNEASRRRSLYYVHSHNEHNKFLSTFDDASVLECYRRAESVVPQQALALENSRLALTSAEKIARRLGEMPDATFVRAAFEAVLCNTPTAEELTECEAALKELKELAIREKKPEPTLRAKINLIQALLNHNDFVTVR